ncbi:hypothetical protein LCGC14_0773930, partial [marine sediment metagenome]
MNNQTQIMQYMHQRLLEESRSSDKIMLLILAAHLPFIYFIVPSGYGSNLQGAIPATLAVIASLAAYKTAQGTLFSRCIIGVSFMVMSMIMIMQQFGRLEMHFHIFTALAFLIIWRDWRVIVISAGAIAIHHALSVPLQLSGVDLGGMPYIAYAQTCDWPTFFLHALFVVIESAVLIFYCLRMQRQFVLANHLIANIQNAATNKDVTGDVSLIPAKNQTDKLFVASLKRFYEMIRDNMLSFQKSSSELSEISLKSSEISSQNESDLNSQNESIQSIVTAINEMT